MRAAVLALPQVTGIRRLRMRDCGPICFFDMTLTLPHIMTLHQAHDVISQAEQVIRQIVPECDITIHYEPDEYED